MDETIYLLHFQQKYFHAQHYLGSTKDLTRRLEEHRSGHGSKLIRAVIAAGIDFQLVRTWPGGRTEERRLHNRNNSPKLCPICSRRDEGVRDLSIFAEMPCL